MMIDEASRFRVDYELSQTDDVLNVRVQTTDGVAIGKASLVPGNLIKDLYALGEQVASLERLEPIGKSLGAVLLGGASGELVSDVLGEAKMRGEMVDFNLYFERDQTHLTGIPWETICDSNGHFLVREGQIQITRCFPYPLVDETIGKVRETGEETLLHIVSCPTGMAAVKPVIASDKVTRDQTEANFEQIIQVLLFQQKEYSGLQYDGHGAIFIRCNACHQLNFTSAAVCYACGKSLSGAKMGSMLALERENGNVDWVPAEYLGNILYNAGLDYMVLLSCKTTQLSKEFAFSSLATDLVWSGVPMVLGMQLPVAANYAQAVISDFYDALEGVQNLIEAFTKARLAHLDGAWYAPALFRRCQPLFSDVQIHYDSRQIDSILPAEFKAGEWALSRLQVHRPTSGAPLNQADLRQWFNLADTVGLKIESINAIEPSQLVDGQVRLSQVNALQSGELEVKLEAADCQISPNFVNLFIDDQMDSPPAIFGIKASEVGTQLVHFILSQQNEIKLAFSHQVVIKDELSPGFVTLQVGSMNIPVVGEDTDTFVGRDCPDCGMPNRLGVRFCRHCGAQLVSAEQAAQEIASVDELEVLPEDKPSAVEPVVCAECGHHNRPEVWFCRHCGAAINQPQFAEGDPVGKMISCPDCGHRNRIDVHYCRHCGKRLSEDLPRVDKDIAKEAVIDEQLVDFVVEERTLTEVEQLEMQICPDCGHQNRPEVKFCRHCGDSLLVDDVQEASKIVEGADTHTTIDSEITPRAQITDELASQDVADYREYDKQPEPVLASEPDSEQVHMSEVTPPDEGATTVMARCPKCGQPNIPGAAFCQNCGIELEVETALQNIASTQIKASSVETLPDGGATSLIIRCYECGHPNGSDATTCQNCGVVLGDATTIMTPCGDCGYPNPPDTLRCKNCGAKLVAENQRSSVQEQALIPDSQQDKMGVAEAAIPKDNKILEANILSVPEDNQPTDDWSTLQMKRCQSCGFPNRPGAGICGNCGAGFAMIDDDAVMAAQEESVDEELCPECAALNPVDAIRCATCGASLASKDKISPMTSSPTPDVQEEESGFAGGMDGTAKETQIEPQAPSLPPTPKTGPVRDVSLVYCKQCGYGNMPDAKYCQDCGEDLDDVTAVIQPSSSDLKPDSLEDPEGKRGQSEGPVSTIDHSVHAGKTCRQCGYANPSEALVCRQCNTVFETSEESMLSRKTNRQWWRFWQK